MYSYLKHGQARAEEGKVCVCLVQFFFSKIDYMGVYTLDTDVETTKKT